MVAARAMKKFSERSSRPVDRDCGRSACARDCAVEPDVAGCGVRDLSRRYRLSFMGAAAVSERAVALAGVDGGGAALQCDYSGGRGRNGGVITPFRDFPCFSRTKCYLWVVTAARFFRVRIARRANKRA